MRDEAGALLVAERRPMWSADDMADAYGESETYGNLVSGLLEQGEFARALSVVDRFETSQHHYFVTPQRIAIAMACARDVRHLDAIAAVGRGTR